ncbi:hypothetical protein B0J13DRAFT_679389 [Dactylonectria estremocensis]|uniref:Fucose-specific lectin n=1 Tax=Dactylonectria estremocensis TaxID=1079267 RepID=A0A9P9IMF0_9HYPO|nr:hypothetical protein B0J13DRAFT_679389 [Dactylonectria estremocensis]
MASPHYSDLPEVYSEPGSNLPEVAPPVTSSLPEVVGGAKHDGAYHAVPGQDGKLDREQFAALGGDNALAERRIWGLKRKTFFIVLAIAIVVIIGAVVGGVVGALVGKNDSDSDSDSSSSTTTSSGSSPTPTTVATNVLPKSQLASSNWTDNDGYEHYYLFYQNRQSEIMSSIWDSENKTWEARGVTDNLESSVELNTIRGTSIASTAWRDSDNDFNIRLYFLLESNVVGELWTSGSHSGSMWRQDDLGVKTFVKPAKGSNLATCRPNMGNSSWPPIALLFQNDDQDIVFMAKEGSNWGSAGTFATATNSSGLALTSLYQKDEDSLDLPLWRPYYDSSDKLQEYLIDPLLDIGASTMGSRLGDLPDGTTSNFAAVGYNLYNLMVINIEEDGTLTGRYWNDANWSEPEAPGYKSSPSGFSASSKFTAISVHAGRRIYGIVDGEILEWKFEKSTPMDWIYIGKVTTVSDDK